MNRMKQIFMGVVLLAAAAAAGHAQITVTASDVSGQLTIGNYVQNHWDLAVGALDIGTPGPSTWDFSALRNDSTMTLTSVDLSTTPFTGTFSGATHALYSPITYLGIAGKAYIYISLGTNMLNLGVGAIANASVPQFPTNLMDTYTPSDVTYGLPMTNGTSWTSDYTEHVVFTLLGSTALDSTYLRHYTYVVDGYGSMKMPGGNVFDALRVRRADSTAARRRVGYMFLAKNGASVQFWLGDPNAPNQGNVGVAPGVQWSAPFNTAVEPATGSTAPKEFALQQNYPNPFNPSTVVGYQVPATSTITLAVYDLLGREVAVLASGVKEAGRYEATWNAAGMPSGVYLYRMTVDGGQSFTKRMMLVK
jgi:hypothetical protein